MNAQEAIEIVEELLKEFREESENGLTLESKKEALEIVLEFAKERLEVEDDIKTDNTLQEYIDKEFTILTKRNIARHIKRNFNNAQVIEITAIPKDGLRAKRLLIDFDVLRAPELDALIPISEKAEVKVFSRCFIDKEEV